MEPGSEKEEFLKPAAPVPDKKPKLSSKATKTSTDVTCASLFSGDHLLGTEGELVFFQLPDTLPSFPEGKDEDIFTKPQGGGGAGGKPVIKQEKDAAGSSSQQQKEVKRVSYILFFLGPVLHCRLWNKYIYHIHPSLCSDVGTHANQN